MNKELARIYRCPITLEPLTLEVTKEEEKEVLEGVLLSPNGTKFPISEGIPDLTWPRDLAPSDAEFRETYNRIAEEYEKFADFPFMTFGESQHDLRVKMTDMLNLSEGDKVLEVGSGDGRGSKYMADAIGEGGVLFMQELSPAFLKKSIERVSETPATKHYSVANASYIAFPDNHFDAAHHFGGINTFAEVGRCLKELARVVKPGGKVVVGDESMGPWLRETEMGKIMMNSNPLLRYEIPFDQIPVEARDVRVEWVLKGAFFLLEFTVGEGEPVADYHIPIPSQRGGTHWTRYYGHLEGVTDEAKEMAYRAQKESGVSMHEWLDSLIKRSCEKNT